ncbi:MAG TPA: tRNA pseudouridine(38-40) synthase TruA [Thermoanaerobaculia bacterium]|nr:tRNA pseudouridine(38-40) synthase TruA [Thermoanaerobaculia bacterium]
MPTYRLTIEYEGTRYHGWQEQKNARSVTGELRRALEEAGGTVKEIGGSGRTDAGVHALAQVAHLRMVEAVDPESFRREANDLLPADIHVLSLSQAPAKFHARHDAVLRSYLYQISRRRTALAKRFVWWVKRPLDPGRMAEAATFLPGKHDFRLFCERPAEQPSTLVVVEGVEVVTEGALVLVRLTASHFLWKMVRRVVGTLVRVGAGELPPTDFQTLLAARPLRPGRGLPAEWTAPPSGLFLERVVYKGDPPLGPVVAAVPVSGEDDK